MGLYKRGSVWWMSFTHNGEQFRRSTETEDKKLSTRIFDKLKGEIAEGKWFEKLPGDDYTFKDLMDKYLVEHSAVNKAASSHKRDKSLSAHLNKVFGEIYLTDIAPKMISEYKTTRRNEGASPRTINYELVLMSHTFNLACGEWELVKENPVKKVEKEKVRNQIERWLSADEEKRLLKASPKWLQEIIVFAINTGMRQSEILDLKWSQIDFSRGTLTISEQKNEETDTLPLNKTALMILEEKFKLRKEEVDYVFTSQNGTRMGKRNLFRAFDNARIRAKVQNFRFHDLRHTFATRLVQKGADLYKVQKLGRWKTLSMVTRYGHHNAESLRSVIEIMDEGIEKGIITNLAQSQKNQVTRSSLRLVSG